MDRASSENEIGDFLEHYRNRTKWEYKIADFIEFFRDRARWETEIGGFLEGLVGVVQDGRMRW
jgi:hypothetical protein